MIQERNPQKLNPSLCHDTTEEGGRWSPAISCPGLTSGFEEIKSLADDLPKRLAVFSYKSLAQNIWLLFVGGTGTGKSTLFNAFCGRSLSETGVERPKTFGPIAYVHQDSPILQGFPFPAMSVDEVGSQDPHGRPSSGKAGHVLILKHSRGDWSHIIAVDTPDLDSVEAENRGMTEDLYLLSDVVIFVTSQEKYADEVPYQFLVRVIQEEKPCFLLINKVHEPLRREEVEGTFKTQGIVLREDRLWLIPYMPGQASASQSISGHPAFLDFVNRISEPLSPEGAEILRSSQHARRAEELERRVGRLTELLGAENRASEKWLAGLEALYKDTCLALVRAEKRRFKEESREYLRREIRNLFSKYDLLAKPRRFVREVLLMPFRLLGLYKDGTEAAHRNALLKVRKKIDLTPLQGALEKFNLLVLERLCPSDEAAPVSRALRHDHLALDERQVKAAIWKEQDRLEAWLGETFQNLARSLPRQKKWGIYSTSILWGILILCFEIVVGGGFTMLDAVLDSALAPFLTKGAVELFAYREIQKIARELAKRYQQGLLSVVEEQRNRYVQCLKSLVTPPETVEDLKRLHKELLTEKA